MAYSLISQADLDVIGFQEFEEAAVRPVPVAGRLALGRLPRPVPRPRLDPRLDRLAHRRVEAGRGQQHRDPLLRRRHDPAPGHQAGEHGVGPRGVVLQHPQPGVHAQPRQQRALARRRGRHRGPARQRARRRRHARRVHRRLQRPRPRSSARSSATPTWSPPTAVATAAAATPPTAWTSTGSSAPGMEFSGFVSASQGIVGRVSDHPFVYAEGYIPEEPLGGDEGRRAVGRAAPTTPSDDRLRRSVARPTARRHASRGDGSLPV